MPTPGWGHSHYWQGTPSTGVPPSTVVTGGGYAAWQGAVAGSGLGGLQPWYERAVARVSRGWAWLCRYGWLLRALWAVRHLDDEQRAQARVIVDLLRHPAYRHARLAVRLTARTQRLNEPQAWVNLSHLLHARYVWAENAWRHLHACDQFEQLIRADDQGSTATNAERNLLIECAYQAYKAAGK